MSTIASPRDSPLPRRMPSSQNASTTPTSSSRPSLETSRSLTSSPNPNTHSVATLPSISTTAPATAAAKRTNRAALREYYKLKAGGAPGSPGATPAVEVTDPFGGAYYSEVAPSEMDAADFDAEAYVRRALEGSGLVDLLRIYAGVLKDIRTLDAEKKSLVYDNYSRLITATETIRKVGLPFLPFGVLLRSFDFRGSDGR